MGRYDLIIFDCDGTLVESELLANTALLTVLHRIGFTQYTLEYCLTYFMGRALSKIWKMVEEDHHTTLPSNMTDRVIAEVAKNRATMMKTVPGAMDVVRAVAATHKICVASNGERENVVGSLDVTGLNTFFPDNTIFTAAQVPNPKPAPDLFLFAAKTMGADPTRTLVIEDSVTGASAGLAAGMDVIGYTGVHHTPVDQTTALKNLGVKAVIHDLSGILPFLS